MATRRAVVKLNPGVPFSESSLQTSEAQDPQLAAPATPLAMVLAPALAACGGGGAAEPAAPTVVPAAAPTEAQASRFLAQASMGASRVEIASVRALGYAGWLDAQFSLPASGTRWDALLSRGLDDPIYRNTQAGFDASSWRKLLSSPDTLRQRITLALSEILVLAIGGLNVGGWRAFTGAAYLDLLEVHAFGQHRALVQAVSLSPAMGVYLTYQGSAKASGTSGALPDENYARELMQLFTIGLVELNADGTPRLAAGATLPTYDQDDVSGLARVFTGWVFDGAGLSGTAATASPEFQRRPMVQLASRYETGAKQFLGTTIAAGTDATSSLTRALDTLCSHANVGPFFCRQLIQRLVTSNPSPAYVARIAAVFSNDGLGQRGNLRAVVRSLLLDAEAREAPAASNLAFGKLREPILRLAGWARAFNVQSASGLWAVGDTTDAATRLGQSPLRSPSVFNFFRPGYIPPNTSLASAALVAPEFQITNESSVMGYLNFMQRLVSNAIGDVQADYSSLLLLAESPQALVDELNLLLAAGQIGGANRARMVTALGSMPSGSDAARRNRVQAAVLLCLAAPDYLVQQ